MPARFFARFLHNHGMLTIDDRPQWMTVVGGSRAYVDRILFEMPDLCGWTQCNESNAQRMAFR